MGRCGVTYGQFDPRLPFAPLESAARAHTRPWVDDADQVIGADRLVAEACGVGRRTIMRWRRQGLTWDMADKAACALGLHPVSVWHDWFARAAEEAA